jgi:selenium-binding protein 1
MHALAVGRFDAHASSGRDNSSTRSRSRFSRQGLCKLKETTMRRSSVCLSLVVSLYACLPATTAIADETCNSPYISNLIKGQEDFVHVWTLGVEGLGDGSDKLVTIDANPSSKTYGKVINTLSVGGRGEAHHMGFTDDRKYLWAGGLEDSKIYVFDVGTEPAKPKLIRTITDLPAKTTYVGPHTFYALPGRMLIGNLSNSTDKGGVTGLALYNNKGTLIGHYAMPTTTLGGVKGDGYGYDVAVNPAKNVLLTSSFAGYQNYMRNLGDLIKDSEAMKHFGATMVVWNLKSMRPSQVLSVPGAPLEIRWSLVPGQNWAITAAALTSKLWLVKPGEGGMWSAKEVGTIGDPTKIPLPVDISITADGRGLWVNTFMDGTTHYFDISDPEHPKDVYTKHTGSQVNMISQSWDGKRIYITSSLLANWDKTGADNQQFLRVFNWDGHALTPAFELDFLKEKLGRPHHMKFTAKTNGSQSLAALARR